MKTQINWVYDAPNKDDIEFVSAVIELKYNSSSQSEPHGVMRFGGRTVKYNFPLLQGIFHRGEHTKVGDDYPFLIQLNKQEETI